VITISFAVMIGAVVLSLLSLRSSRGDALGIPLVAIGAFVFLYVVQPFSLVQSGAADTLFTEWQMVKALFVPALMLSCYVSGWRAQPKRIRVVSRPAWSPRGLWTFGLGTMVVGFSLYLIFLQRSGGVLYSFSQPHGRAMAFEQNTAYLYDGPWWMLSGSVMMVFATSKLRLEGWRKVAFILSFVVLLGQAVLTGSRGPLFSTCATLLVSYSITRAKKVSLARACALLAMLGFSVLMMVGFREVLHLGTDVSDAPSVLAALDSSISLDESAKANGVAGQEFVLHAALIDTVDQTHKFGLGLGWLYYLAINPIPKILWPEKHYPDTPGVTWDDTVEKTGIAAADGAACGIVADLYRQFGLLEALFLYLLGRFSRKLFVSACRLDSPLPLCAYVMLYAVSLNMFAQGFGSIFVSFGFSMAPVLLFTFLSGIGSRKRFRSPAAPLPPRTMEGAPAQCS